jgi:hypothetical protein
MLHHSVCLLSEGSWNTCEKRHHDGLPAVSLYWPDSKRNGFNLRHSLQVLDTVLTAENDDVVVVVTEEKCSGSSSIGIFIFQCTECTIDIKMYKTVNLLIVLYGCEM